MTDTLHLQHLGACRTAFANVPESAGRILLVGEDNPISAAPEHALFCAPDGCAGQRLQAKIFGLPRAEYLAMWRTNLCVGGWSIKKARDRAAALMHGEVPWRAIVMLGRKVADAFSASLMRSGYDISLNPFESAEVPSVEAMPRLTLYSLPHPSGRNLIWNRPGPVTDAQQIMCEVADDLAWGLLT